MILYDRNVVPCSFAPMEYQLQEVEGYHEIQTKRKELFGPQGRLCSSSLLLKL